LTRLSKLNAENVEVVKELLAVNDKQGHGAIIILAAIRGEKSSLKRFAPLRISFTTPRIFSY
jgi:hypothetical protein